MNKKNKMKFIIVSPRQKYGGAIALHKLCYELNALGYDAKIFYKPGAISYKNKNTFWFKYFLFFIKDGIKLILSYISFFSSDADFLNGYNYFPVKNTKRKFTTVFNRKKTIVVYPEVEYGNFLKAKHVVRWLLFHNRYDGDDKAYGKKDLFFCYREVFNDKKLNPDCRMLKLTNFDYDLYKPTNNIKREGTCYIIRKGSSRLDLPSSFDGVVIDNLSEEEKVKIFNSCEYCISYDTQTFYTTIAAYCGCKTFVIPEDGKSRADYLTSEDKHYGIAYGYSEEEICFANDTISMVKEEIQELENENKKNVIDFVSVVSNFFECDEGV